MICVIEPGSKSLLEMFLFIYVTLGRNGTSVLVIFLSSNLEFLQEIHQEIWDPNATSLYFATPLAFNALDGGVLLGRSP